MDCREQLEEYIRSIKIISSHNHHLPYALCRGTGLTELLESSYVVWAARPPKITETEKWREYLLKNGTNSFLRWIFPALEEIYGIPFRPETLTQIDAAIRAAYGAPAHPLKILTEKCRFEKIVNERQPNPGDDLGHPELFSPSFRCDCFFSGYQKDRPEPNGFFAWSLFKNQNVKTMEEYFSEMRSAIKEKKALGCVALKVAIAYERPIVFENTDLKKAYAALNNESPTEREVRDFGDAVMFEIAKISAEFNMPLQIHTGTGQYDKTNPMGLLKLIRENPDTKFHLLHGGFPWVDDTYALLNAFTNVFSDTCWIPYLSTTAARTYIKTALEVSDCHRLTWGDDTWRAEDSLGALRAMEHSLSLALSDMITDGAIDMDYAKYIAQRIMHDNAKSLFNL
jgi:hypothetical protein